MSGGRVEGGCKVDRDYDHRLGAYPGDTDVRGANLLRQGAQLTGCGVTESIPKHLDILHKNLCGAVDRAYEAGRRIENVNDRLQGPEPQDVKTASPATPVPSSFEGRLNDSITTLERFLSIVEYQMERLERVI